MKVLITGGAGYIGSSIASACRDFGIRTVVVDDLSTGRPEFVPSGELFRGDIADGSLIDDVFRVHPDIDATIHCAARTVVSESVSDPLTYYEANVRKSIDLVSHLVRNDCGRVVFSSSASVYGDAEGEIAETAALAPTSPYAATKAITEQLLRDVAESGALRAVALRYFNPIGADPLMRTGQQNPAPTHVLGLLLESQRRDLPFVVTGTDWATRDGSGLRDYIHVWDLAQAHVRTLTSFDVLTSAARPFDVFNVGTGNGTTVRELVEAYEHVVGRPARTIDGPRRPGDVPGGYASVAKFSAATGWTAERSIADGIRDSLAWLDRSSAVLSERP